LLRGESPAPHPQPKGGNNSGLYSHPTRAFKGAENIARPRTAAAPGTLPKKSWSVFVQPTGPQWLRPNIGPIKSPDRVPDIKKPWRPHKIQLTPIGVAPLFEPGDHWNDQIAKAGAALTGSS